MDTIKVCEPVRTCSRHPFGPNPYTPSRPPPCCPTFPPPPQPPALPLPLLPAAVAHTQGAPRSRSGRAQPSATLRLCISIPAAPALCVSAHVCTPAHYASTSLHRKAPAEPATPNLLLCLSRTGAACVLAHHPHYASTSLHRNESIMVRRVGDSAE